MKRSVCTPKFLTAKEIRVKQVYTSAKVGHVMTQARIVKGGKPGYKVFQANTLKELFQTEILSEAKAHMASLNLYRV